MQEPTPGWYSHPIKFTGSGSEYFRIWIVNWLLMIVTLGLYFPWAKVRRRRYFYGNTWVGEHAFDFHGKPHRMLIGWGIVVGFFLLLSQVKSVHTSVIGAIGFLLGLAVVPMLIVWAGRFRLSNTSWCGMRFRFVGNLAGAYEAYLPTIFLAAAGYCVVRLWDPLNGAEAALAAGLTHLMPFLCSALACLVLVALLYICLQYFLLKRYLHQHFVFANLQTSFNAGVFPFFKIFAPQALIVALVGAFAVVQLSPVVDSYTALTRGIESRAQNLVSQNLNPADIRVGPGGVILVLDPEKIEKQLENEVDKAVSAWAEIFEKLMQVISRVAILAGTLSLFVAPYTAMQLQNLVWSSTRSQDVEFESRLRYKPFLVLTLKNWVLIFITGGFYRPYAAVAVARMKLAALTVQTRMPLDALVNQLHEVQEHAVGEMALEEFGLDIGF